MSILNRRSCFGILAGVLAFVAGPRSRISDEAILEATETDNVKEFEIVNGWVLHRQDTVTRK